MKIAFNVRLEGDGNILLEEDFVKVKEGKTYSAARDKTVVKYMDKKYTKACLIFSGGLRVNEDKTVPSLCNKIVGANG